MRAGALVLGALLSAGCLSAHPGSDGEPLHPPWTPPWGYSATGHVEAGAEVPLLTSAILGRNAFQDHAIEVPRGYATVAVRLNATAPAVVQLRDSNDTVLCVARAGRVCSSLVPDPDAAEWLLRVVSLAPGGADYKVSALWSPEAPVLLSDGVPAADLDVFRTESSGGEPTLAWLADGRIIVAPDEAVWRLEADGSLSDVTPLLDATTGQTLDPFLVGDPATGRIYVSQLAQCLRLSWTDDGGESWTTNPAACAGPEQHHQKIAVGPGPTPLARTVHVATMNLASWLTTDELVIVHSRSLDGGLTWTQNPAMVKQAAGMEARAVGNIAVLDDGTIAIIAYLCDRFVDAEYNGVAVGTSTDFGLTWHWRRIAEGGGRCEGIDPGIAAAGTTLYAAWEDLSNGTGAVWWSRSDDGGATWAPRRAIPTGALGSFVFTDAAASAGRLAVAFLGTADTGIGPTQAPGWSRWHPYLASLDLTQANATWTVERLQEDPVQLGPICMDGPKCLDGARNLLDFIDVQLGADGRAAVAYADGCEADCEYSWQSRDSQLRVARER